ncbi:MAG: GNAT family N-acetyltransferase [Sarcina sp.]
MEFKQHKSIDDLFAKDVMQIDTGSYIARGVTSGDWEDMIEIYQNKYLHMYAKAQYIHTEKMAINLLTSIMYNFSVRKAITWMVTRKSDGENLGIISLSNISYIDRKAELGYALKESYMRQGVMGEVLKKIVDVLLEYGFVRIEVNIFKENIASIRLCEKVGFENEGLRRKYLFNTHTDTYLDSYVFAIVKEEVENI